MSDTDRTVRPAAANEDALLAAAKHGDESAFTKIADTYRSELNAHCYRMLGSTHDAEDALQEAMLRAWKGLPRFEGRSSLRSWLYRIATNTCLDSIGRRPKRVLPIDYGPAADPHDGPGKPLTESVWIEPLPDDWLEVDEDAAPMGPEARYEQRESVELAFTAALQHLPAKQRAALILFEVLGFSAKEVAETLETSVASVNSALQRARAAVEERTPELSQQATLRALGEDGLRDLVDGYVEAWERGDVEAIVGMLTEDAVVTMPPMASWYRGPAAIRVFLRDFAFAGRWDSGRDEFEKGGRTVQLVPIRANGQIGFAAYNLDPESGVLKPYALQVLTLSETGIAEITGFVTTGFTADFGLPESMPAT